VESKKAFVVGAIFLLVGLGIVGASVQSLVAGPSSAVMCNNRVMQPGDRCEIRSNGSSTTHSYSEMKSDKNSIVAPVVGMIFGGIVLLIGGAAVRSGLRERRDLQRAREQRRPSDS
jgi:hypothetical protein